MQSQIVWFTGLSGAGKTTLCHSVARELCLRNYPAHILDGDELRNSLCADLAFSTEDRVENIRRITCVARMIAQHGIIVLVAVISPLKSMRESARQTTGHFCEVFVNASLAVCEARDTKGLYKRAREGQIPDFTGIGSPYEEPTAPEVTCNTESESVLESTNKVIVAILGQRSSAWEGVPKLDIRPTLAVDFDGVIADYDGWRGRGVFGEPRKDVVEALRILADEKWKIIIHTTRSPDEITPYLRSASIPFEEINQNSDYKNEGMKPVATVYWDDRALPYSGNAMRDLEQIRSFRTWSGRR